MAQENKIIYSDVAQARLASLTSTDGVLAVRMRTIKGGKVEVEFAQKIDTGKSSINVLALLNASDERFSVSGGPSRTWMSVEPVDLKKMFGFELAEGEDAKELLSILPEMGGNIFGLQITEVPESKLPKRFRGEDDKYLESNLKRAGADGDFFYLPNDERVGRYIDLVAIPKGQEVPHKLITNATIGKQNVESLQAAAGTIATRI